MTWGAPEWLFLVPALAAVGWRARSLRLHEPLRALALALFVLALADPQGWRGGGGLDVWLLVDRSDSAGEATLAQGPEIAGLLERSKRAGDRVVVVDYAAQAVRRDQGDPVERGGTHRTRTGAAIELALAQRSRDRAARLLVVSDGYATEPLGEAAEQLLRSGVPLDYRLLGGEHSPDWRVGSVSLPARVLPGEAFLLEAVIHGADTPAVAWEVWRGDAIAAQGSAAVRDGEARIRLTDRLGGGGAMRYTVRIRAPGDVVPQNDAATAWLEVTGGPRALLLTNYPDDPLAGLLAAQGLAVERITEPGRLRAAQLTGARLVVLNNVPAYRVAPEFLASLDFFVRSQGGGLLMAGGENSFGSGGYFASAIDELLPVSMELRKEHRRLATALALVLDRSGSMAASVGGGQTKMDLANSGAARAIELLGELDAAAVLAVDSTAHVVSPLAQVGPNRGRLVDAASRIVSAGGGIFVGVGLEAGWAELQRAETGQRHLVLFADAADAEEPDNYVETIEAMRRGGATASVIGLGTESDADAALLKDVAARGGGRIFFTANPYELPAVFAQETVSIARSAFLKEPVGTKPTPGWAEIAARAPAWLSEVDGYNLSYLRPGATAALLTTDDYAAPLVATWSRGAGRVAAVSFPLGGAHSARVRGWAGYGDFAQTLTRWLAGEDTPPGMALRPRLDGDRLTVDLLYDETWTARLAQAAPVAQLAIGEGGLSGSTVQPLVWEKLAPGHLRATAQLAPGQVVRGAVQAGGTALAFGPVTTSGAGEWSFPAGRREELRELSRQSGGRERFNLATIWDEPRTASLRSLRAWWLAGALLCLLADALLTRLELSPAASLLSAWRRATTGRGRGRPARP